MRKLTFIVAVTAALAGCNSDAPNCPTGIGMDCIADLAMPDQAMPRDLAAAADLHCTGDLAGTPLQICGMPDAGFSPQQCICVGDP